MANIDYKCGKNHECYAPARVTMTCCPRYGCDAPIVRVGRGSKTKAEAK